MADEQISSHRSPSRVLRCLILSLSFVIVVPVLCITLALKLGPGGEVLYESNSDSMDINRTIYLYSDLVSVDIPKATMVIDWFIWDTCTFNCTDVDIFFDTNLLSSDHRDYSTPYSTDIPTDPIFRWNASATDLRQNFPIFRTDIVVINDVYGSMVYYPFDSYVAGVFAFAQDAVTKESVSLSIDAAYGLIAGLKVTAEIEEENHPDWDFGFRTIAGTLTFQRSSLVIGYCLTITLTFWLVTLMICLIVIKTMIFGFRQRHDIVPIPMGTMFVFTLLRFSMPGAPDSFGNALDYAGLLPCFVLLSISTVIMLGINLLTDPHHTTHGQFIWNDIGNMLRHYIRKPSFDSHLAHQTSGVL
ncbi:hypothetical protein ARMGADRAFT_1086888 [Armillaria gallica]|uniref:DUF4436 domain-containing protein n=1 Tax=Armillaria gallica TaxID=47427 RepID=A0A2H3DD09_ARMGA|nr:hypothetical protein ARMGADRAFT_1086888 [Armillaria gallica]